MSAFLKRTVDASASGVQMNNRPSVRNKAQELSPTKLETAVGEFRTLSRPEGRRHTKIGFSLFFRQVSGGDLRDRRFSRSHKARGSLWLRRCAVVVCLCPLALPTALLPEVGEEVTSAGWRARRNAENYLCLSSSNIFVILPPPPPNCPRPGPPPLPSPG